MTYGMAGRSIEAGEESRIAAVTAASSLGNGADRNGPATLLAIVSFVQRFLPLSFLKAHEIM